MRKDSQEKIILSLGFFLLLFLSSCSWLKKEQVQKEQLQEEQIQKHAGDVDKQAQMEIETGKFQGAIDLYRETYQTHPQDPKVRNGYIKTLESMKRKGDQAFEKNDFKLAEKIYETLMRNWVHFSDFSPSLSFRKEFLEKKIKMSRCSLTEEQVSSYLEAGEFRKAIDICKEMYKRYPQDPTVRSGYIRTLEAIKTRGDRAFEERDFVRAGCVYEIVLRNVSSVSPLNGSFSFSKEGLIAKIRSCKKILFENGLKQYRSGNLNQAIALWKSILIFDPENEEIKKAVDMATVQVKNLQNAK
jgi:tetratricopeptide (TPR) repeat protein